MTSGLKSSLSTASTKRSVPMRGRRGGHNRVSAKNARFRFDAGIICQHTVVVAPDGHCGFPALFNQDLIAIIFTAGLDQ